VVPSETKYAVLIQFETYIKTFMNMSELTTHYTGNIASFTKFIIFNLSNHSFTQIHVTLPDESNLPTNYSRNHNKSQPHYFR